MTDGKVVHVAAFAVLFPRREISVALTSLTHCAERAREGKMFARPTPSTIAREREREEGRKEGRRCSFRSCIVKEAVE